MKALCRCILGLYSARKLGLYVPRRGGDIFGETGEGRRTKMQTELETDAAGEMDMAALRFNPMQVDSVREE